MAASYLLEGATDLSVGANWTDTIGFQAAAELVIQTGTQDIQAGLNQSANSINYLDILPGFSGNIGGPSGALQFDADNTAESSSTVLSRVRYWAAGGRFYFSANGGNTLAHFVQIDTGGEFYGVTGIMKNVHLSAARLARFSDAVLATGGTWKFDGGRSEIVYHATNNIPTLNISGGGHTIKRGVTTLNISGGDVTLDCQAVAIGTINLRGTGRLKLLNCGTITSLVAEGGTTLDVSALGRAVTVTTGEIWSRCNYIRSPLLTIGTKVPVGRISLS